MIKNIFPVNIYIKDFEMTEEWTNELKNVSVSIFQSYLSEKNIPKNELADDEVPFFTEENIKKYKVMNELQEIFIEGFYSLASSYENNVLTREKIKEMVCRNSGKLPFMSKNSYKSVHSHVASSAFAIFYLSDIDNGKNGGKLILRDPSFNSNSHFKPEEKYEIETKKNRLIVAPAYVWHEVTPYFGNEDRLTIVINLDFV
jgi:hypothetical protein